MRDPNQPLFEQQTCCQIPYNCLIHVTLLSFGLAASAFQQRGFLRLYRGLGGFGFAGFVPAVLASSSVLLERRDRVHELGLYMCQQAALSLWEMAKQDTGVRPIRGGATILFASSFAVLLRRMHTSRTKLPGLLGAVLTWLFQPRGPAPSTTEKQTKSGIRRRRRRRRRRM